MCVLGGGGGRGLRDEFRVQTKLLHCHQLPPWLSDALVDEEAEEEAEALREPADFDDGGGGGRRSGRIEAVRPAL